ncbi:hypothetical protein BDQ17DRAFT_1349255 [Cyathus striatus]|nr:hypothetical protein BDQ17DRAFT_1349255 [Cyathus striatus]
MYTRLVLSMQANFGLDLLPLTYNYIPIHPLLLHSPAFLRPLVSKGTSILSILPMAASYPHSIPTPPFSPENHGLPDDNSENPLKSTINLLDSLVSFYQHERMWVYRTRAMLEEAFPDPPIMSSHNNNNNNNNNPSSSSSSSSAYSAGIYPQPLPSPSTSAVSSGPIGSFVPADNAERGSQPQTRWMRRKRGFKLRLEGLAPKNRRVLSAAQPQQDTLQPREQILEMFEKMMEARMESCERVNKLVRNANRANLHNR